MRVHISKVQVWFWEDGKLLGSEDVFVTTKTNSDKEINTAALEVAKVSTLALGHSRLYLEVKFAIPVPTTHTNLTEILKDWGLESKDLDEAVIGSASQMASNVNNEGLSGQIRFMGTGLDTALTVTEVLNSKKKWAGRIHEQEVLNMPKKPEPKPEPRYRCPECNCISIQVSILTQEDGEIGTDPDSDRLRSHGHEWDDASPASCLGCGFMAVMAAFDTEK